MRWRLSQLWFGCCGIDLHLYFVSSSLLMAQIKRSVGKYKLHLFRLSSSAQISVSAHDVSNDTNISILYASINGAGSICCITQPWSFTIHQIENLLSLTALNRTWTWTTTFISAWYALQCSYRSVPYPRPYVHDNPLFLFRLKLAWQLAWENELQRPKWFSDAQDWTPAMAQQ